MRVLYVDESGNPKDSRQTHFILAGVSVLAGQTPPLSQSLEAIAARFAPANPQAAELHGTDMRTGKNFWRKISPARREAAIADGLNVLAAAPPNARAFAVAVRYKNAKNPMQAAFTELANLYLAGAGKPGAPGEQALMFFDKSEKHERAVQMLAARYRAGGEKARAHFRKLLEVPTFIDSRASRLVQLADLVAYAVGRKLNHGDETYFNIIKPRFDAGQAGEKMRNYRILPAPSQ